MCKRAGVGEELARELEEFGLLDPRGSGKDKRYGESDVEIASACAKLARFGIAPRMLRRFRDVRRTGGERDRAARRALAPLAQS